MCCYSRQMQLNLKKTKKKTELKFMGPFTTLNDKSIIHAFNIMRGHTWIPQNNLHETVLKVYL